MMVLTQRPELECDLVLIARSFQQSVNNSIWLLGLMSKEDITVKFALSAQTGSEWEGVAGCGTVWQGVAGCGRVWQGVAGCGRVWQDVAGAAGVGGVGGVGGGRGST